MNIIYELNPPKILQTNQMDLHIFDSEKKRFLDRALKISQITNYIHLTDSVLGVPRMSSIFAAHLVKNSLNGSSLNISCSIRTRDRNLNSIIQSAADSIVSNVKSLLFILGDKPAYSPTNTDGINEKPSEVVHALNNLGFDKYINLELSVPNKITNFKAFQKKIEAKPKGFVSQSVGSISEVTILMKYLKPYELDLIPCIMVPSQKNRKAASMIGLDWSEYENDFIKFIDQIASEGIDEILLTSPNSFDEGVDVLNKLL